MIEEFLYRVGDVLEYGLTGTVPGWRYDYALVSQIYWQEGLGWMYLMDSCDRDGNISPVSLSTGQTRHFTEHEWPCRLIKSRG